MLVSNSAFFGEEENDDGWFRTRPSDRILAAGVMAAAEGPKVPSRERNRRNHDSIEAEDVRQYGLKTVVSRSQNFRRRMSYNLLNLNQKLHGLFANCYANALDIRTRDISPRPNKIFV